MKTNIICFLFAALIFLGLDFSARYFAEAEAAAQSQQKIKEEQEALAQCVAAKASKQAKDAIAATFWGVRQLDVDGNIGIGPDPQVKERALQAMSTLVNICMQEQNPNNSVTVYQSFESAWRLAELMTTDIEFAEAVSKAEEARMNQEKADAAKNINIKEADKLERSWAIK